MSLPTLPTALTDLRSIVSLSYKDALLDDDLITEMVDGSLSNEIHGVYSRRMVDVFYDDGERAGLSSDASQWPTPLPQHDLILMYGEPDFS